MKRPFQLKAVALDADGSEDVFGIDYAIKMGLPFHEGWDHWRVYQGSHLVGSFPDYELARTTCSALNATVVLMAA